MKLVAILFLLVAFTCFAGVSFKLKKKKTVKIPKICIRYTTVYLNNFFYQVTGQTLLQEIRLRNLLRKQAVLQALSGVAVTAAPITVATTTTISPNPTPSAALVKTAAAEGVTRAQLLALTPDELKHLEALQTLGLAQDWSIYLDYL